MENTWQIKLRQTKILVTIPNLIFFSTVICCIAVLLTWSLTCWGFTGTFFWSPQATSSPRPECGRPQKEASKSPEVCAPGRPGPRRAFGAGAPTDCGGGWGPPSARSRRPRPGSPLGGARWTPRPPQRGGRPPSSPGTSMPWPSSLRRSGRSNPGGPCTSPRPRTRALFDF